MKRLHAALLWMSMVDRDVLERCPEEESRFVAAGGAVLTTTGLAFLSGAFACHQLLHLPTAPAIGLGLLFALAIMNIERYVQGSIRRQRNTFLTLLSAAPRIGLAVLIGLVLSIPPVLKIFEAEIGAQVRVDRHEDQYRARQALAGQFAEVPALQRRQARLEKELNTVTTGVALKTSPAYRALTGRLHRLQRWAREESDPRLTRSYQRQANRTALQLGPLRTQLLREEARNTATARAEKRAELAATREGLRPMLDEKQAKDDSLQRAFAAPVGLADRMKALGTLTENNAAVRWIERVLWLFILTIDSLPALMKTLMCIGRPRAYELIEDDHQRTTVKASATIEKARRKDAVRAARESSRLQEQTSRSRLERQAQLQGKLDDIYIRTMEKALVPHAEDWALRTAARYIDAMDKALADDVADDRGAVNGFGLPTGIAGLGWHRPVAHSRRAANGTGDTPRPSDVDGA